MDGEERDRAADRHDEEERRRARVADRLAAALLARVVLLARGRLGMPEPPDAQKDEEQAEQADRRRKADVEELEGAEVRIDDARRRIAGLDVEVERRPLGVFRRRVSCVVVVVVYDVHRPEHIALVFDAVDLVAVAQFRFVDNAEAGGGAGAVLALDAAFDDGRGNGRPRRRARVAQKRRKRLREEDREACREEQQSEQGDERALLPG